jgi:hypothetical protein
MGMVEQFCVGCILHKRAASGRSPTHACVFFVLLTQLTDIKSLKLGFVLPSVGTLCSTKIKWPEIS